MNTELVRRVLEAGIPEPPAGLGPPPIGTIRRRSRRRRAGTATLAAALCLLAGAGVVIAARRVAPHAEPAAPAPAGAPTGWRFAVVGRDDRTVHLAGGWYNSTAAGGPAQGVHLCDDSRAVVETATDRVVVTVYVVSAAYDCGFEVVLRLDAPLGAREIVDGGAGHVTRPVLRESILPTPTRPRGLRPDDHRSPIASTVPHRTWTVYYAAPDGYEVEVSAARTWYAPGLPTNGRLTTHGRDISFSAPAKSGAWNAFWVDQGWQVRVLVRPPSGQAADVPGQRWFLAGLVWP